ncbi:tail protein X [Sporosarcina sp. Marseille-Q4943]|uniref:tail protein X n=1 Tax=Sporosarcina sp. Marseille-Q4943 TaxID=2942204 RepID=UPI00208DAC96|nr:tail protein X [Sporosarcina sp. Marseille-Q4943]
MRTLFVAVILFLTFHIIRIDLGDGTIPLAAFFGNEQPCTETTLKTIHVTTIQGDTIESLFSMYPDSETTFVERLSIFYSLNPHLRNQDLIGGLSIQLPLSNIGQDNCN